MGIYNTVNAKISCSNCHSEELLEVQFSYGEAWRHEYVVGDTLIWGGPLRKYKFPRAERAKLDPALIGGSDVGKREYKRVVVDGTALNCPNCGAEGSDCEVWIEDGRIVRVQIASGDYKFVDSEEPYIVLE